MNKQKHRLWLILPAVLVVLTVFAAVFMADKAMSVGRFVSGENGACLVALDNRPVMVHYIGAVDCSIGDKVLIIHQNVFAESYPEQTKAYFMLKIGEGTEADVPEEALAVLRESEQ